MSLLQLFDNDFDYSSCDEWLYRTETKLSCLGYKKYNQKTKNEDFAYWKVFYDGDEKIYQVGVFFYDFRKYERSNSIPLQIGLQFECMIIRGGDRVDLSVYKDIRLSEFEAMAFSFYNAMSQYV